MKTHPTHPVSLHQQRLIQMNIQPGIAVRLLRVLVGAFFVTMSLALLTGPHAQFGHGGDPFPKPVTAENSLLTLDVHHKYHNLSVTNPDRDLS